MDNAPGRIKAVSAFQVVSAGLCKHCDAVYAASCGGAAEVVLYLTVFWR